MAASNPFALIKTNIVEIPPENKLVVREAFIHMGRLLHAILLANGKASVLPTSWSRNSVTLGLNPVYDLPRLVSRYNRSSWDSTKSRLQAP